jgi:hypothetical protein
MDMKPDGKGGSGPPREPDPERQPPDPDQAHPNQTDPKLLDSDDPRSAALPGAAGPEEAVASTEQDAFEEAAGRPAFPHPQWMVGVVLIFAVLFIAGGLGNPLWLLVGSPFILVLVVYIWVKLASRGKSDES